MTESLTLIIEIQMSPAQKKERFISKDPKSTMGIKTLPAKIVIPVLLAIGLFILTIFLLVIPIIEKNMMDGKREGILHLTESAWSTLNIFYSKSEDGEMSQADAKRAAIAHLQQLRYGPDLEDYFWINDMTPTILMHPYRKDLVGKDVTTFKDPSGKHLFVEVVKTVQEKEAGYVDYLWQWKGDSKKIVPKISYVKGFQPWGWIIGTGIYVEDVQIEIQRITQRLIFTCLGILLLFLIISGYIVRQGMKSQKERINAQKESALREKQLIQADKMTSLGILVAGVAHEINNPATSLMLNGPNLKKAWQAVTPILDDYFKDKPETNVCNMPYKDLKERIHLMINGIGDSAGRIKKIISELKDFSRPPGGNITPDMGQDMDINLVVKKSLDLTKAILKKATDDLSVEYDESVPVIKGNTQKLQQVIINLLVNAAQALENKTQSIKIKTMNIKDDFIRIQVKDSGPGVSDKDLYRLVDPFFTTRRDEGGTGLGLSISEKIVNEHNGLLDFLSVPGKGLTVNVQLPIKGRFKN